MGLFLAFKLNGWAVWMQLKMQMFSISFTITTAPLHFHSSQRCFNQKFRFFGQPTYIATTNLSPSNQIKAQQNLYARVAVTQTIYVLIRWTVSPPQKGFLLDFFPFFFGRVWMQLEMQMCSIPFTALPLLPLDLPNPRSQDSTPNTASGKQLVIFFSDQIQFGYIAKLVIFRATSISPYFKIANQLEIFALDLLFRATLIWLYFKIAFEAIFHKSAPAISKK